MFELTWHGFGGFTRPKTTHCPGAPAPTGGLSSLRPPSFTIQALLLSPVPSFDNKSSRGHSCLGSVEKSTPVDFPDLFTRFVNGRRYLSEAIYVVVNIFMCIKVAMTEVSCTSLSSTFTLCVWRISCYIRIIKVIATTLLDSTDLPCLYSRRNAARRCEIKLK